MQRDPRENARRLYQIAAAQGGYFTSAQTRRAGYAYSQQHYHVARSNWLRIERAPFRLRDFPAAEREDIIRWSLWSHNRKGGAQAVASHQTALSVYALSDLMPSRVHLTVPKSFRKKAPPGCVLHKARLARGEMEPRTGYHVTTPLRTLVDVAGSALSQEHLDQAVCGALERGLVRRRVLESTAYSAKVRQRLDQALLAAQQEGSLP